MADEPVERPTFEGVDDALAVPGTRLRLFDRPEAHAGCRMGIVVATGDDVETARERGETAAERVRIADDAS
ncbi:hypothetical protein BRC97_04215 [Halobacteriales archaeon QS_6_71_20]|nr:MAG: hypothetical protein BRC97_04215 [Halobacteriales archaeon QS_6_71_20]